MKRIWVVTGGESGIGRATGARFAADGNTVVVLDRQTPGELPAGGEYYRVDVGDAEQVRAVVARLLVELGRIDVLVNCAGIGMQAVPFHELDMQVWDELMRVNLGGTVAVVQAVLPSMRARNAGAIVNVGSSFGLIARRDQSAYSVSKAGLTQLARVNGS